MKETPRVERERGEKQEPRAFILLEWEGIGKGRKHLDGKWHILVRLIVFCFQKKNTNLYEKQWDSQVAFLDLRWVSDPGRRLSGGWTREVRRSRTQAHQGKGSTPKMGARRGISHRKVGPLGPGLLLRLASQQIAALLVPLTDTPKEAVLQGSPPVNRLQPYPLNLQTAN